MAYNFEIKETAVFVIVLGKFFVERLTFPALKQIIRGYILKELGELEVFLPCRLSVEDRDVYEQEVEKLAVRFYKNFDCNGNYMTKLVGKQYGSL
jgi:hypothetical protein